MQIGDTPRLEERREPADVATLAIINPSEHRIDDTIATTVAVPDHAEMAPRVPRSTATQQLQTRPQEPNMDLINRSRSGR